MNKIIVYIVFTIAFNTITFADTLIKYNNKVQTLDKYHKEYVSCKKESENKPSVRGEYETKLEYQARINQKVNCDSYKKLEGATIDKNINLSYNADNEFFSFYVTLDWFDGSSLIGEGFNPNTTIYRRYYNYGKSSKYRKFKYYPINDIKNGRQINKNYIKYGRILHFTSKGCSKHKSRNVSVIEQLCGKGLSEFNKKYFYKYKDLTECLIKYSPKTYKNWLGESCIADDAPYHLIQSSVEVSGYSVLLYSSIKTARQLKISEDNLIYRFYVSVNVPNKLIVAHYVEAINLENNEVLFSLGNKKK